MERNLHSALQGNFKEWLNYKGYTKNLNDLVKMLDKKWSIIFIAVNRVIFYRILIPLYLLCRSCQNIKKNKIKYYMSQQGKSTPKMRRAFTPRVKSAHNIHDIEPRKALYLTDKKE